MGKATGNSKLPWDERAGRAQDGPRLGAFAPSVRCPLASVRGAGRPETVLERKWSTPLVGSQTSAGLPCSEGETVLRNARNRELGTGGPASPRTERGGDLLAVSLVFSKTRFYFQGMETDVKFIQTRDSFLG